MLRKKKETLELDSEIEAATVKINYLKDAELNMSSPMQSNTAVSNPVPSVKMPVLGAEAAQATSDASTATQAHLEKRLDYFLHLHDSTAPAVRTKTGVNVQFPLPNLATDRQHSKPVFLPRVSSDIRPQQLSHSYPSAQHSSHSYSSAIPPVISQSYASSDQATRSTVTHKQIPSSTSSSQDKHVIKVLENQSELTRMLMK